MFGKYSGWRILVSLWLFCATALAQEMDLYQAAVDAQGRGVDERNASIATALEKVVIKLTGSRSSSTLEAARGLGGKAADLVQQYRYSAHPSGDAEAGWLLWVRFDPGATQRAMREAGLPVWTGNRPSILLWLGTEKAGDRRFYQAETEPALAEAIERVSRQRGMEFLSPLLDLEDMGRLKPVDLWGGFETRVREASGRYAADLILVGRLARAGRTTHGEWQMLHSAQAETWRESGASVEQALELGLNSAVDRLARRYAPLSTAAGGDSVLVLVRGLVDMHGYLAVMGYFNAADGVESLGPLLVEADQALFRLRVEGGADALRRSASLGRLLMPEANTTVGSPAPLTPDLVFRLAR